MVAVTDVPSLGHKNVQACRQQPHGFGLLILFGPLNARTHVGPELGLEPGFDPGHGPDPGPGLADPGPNPGPTHMLGHTLTVVRSIGPWPRF